MLLEENPGSKQEIQLTSQIVSSSMLTHADVALWLDKNGVWQGVIQDYEGAVQETLAKFCKNGSGSGSRNHCNKTALISG